MQFVRSVPRLDKFPELRVLDKYHWLPGTLFAAAMLLAFGMPGFVWGFLVSTTGSNEEISVLLTKVSSHDIKSFVQKIDELDGVSAVRVLERKRGDQL